MTDDPLSGEQLRTLREHSDRPSQYTAATIRRDYTEMLGEILRLRGELGQAEDLLEHSRREIVELREQRSKLIAMIQEQP